MAKKLQKSYATEVRRLDRIKEWETQLGLNLRAVRANRLKQHEQELFRRAPVAVVIFDDAMLVLDVNPAACQLLRRSTEAIVGTLVAELFDEQLAAQSLRAQNNVQVSLTVVEGQSLRLALTPCFDIQPHVHALFLADLTERHNLQCELAQHTRLETIGRIASGVAHDFNNMLTAILSYAELQMQRLPQDDAARRYAQSIQAAAERASETAKQLLLYSRGQQHAAYPQLDLNVAVREAAGFVGRLIGENIRLVLDLDEQLPLVFADPGELNQVLVNLAVNARDAMPRGGQLLFGTSKRQRNVMVDRSLELSHPQGYVSVFVDDSGSGISPEVMPHIFDPFFTTKAQGQGTGLGLATVYRIVRQCKGQILVNSEPGHGTTFEILLPACAAVSLEMK